MAATSKIHEFPAEMIKAISSNLDNSDFLSFRAVCCKWNVIVDDAFLQKFFSKRRHLFWEPSLDKLILISQERRLAEAVKEIEIVTQCSLLLCPLSECDDESKESTNKGSHSTNYAKWHGHRSNYKDLCKMFLEVLSNLANQKWEVSLAVSSLASEPAYGRNQFLPLRLREYDPKGNLEENYSWREDFGCGVYPHCGHKVAESILETAVESPIYIDGLDIGYNDRSFGLFPLAPFRGLRDLAATDSLRASLSDLMVLKLGVRHDDDNFAKGIEKVFRIAIHLQELFVAVLPDPDMRDLPGDWRSPFEDYGSPAILRSLSSHYLEAPSPLPKLKKLELQWVFISNDVLRQALSRFIQMFDATLTHLKLTKILFGRRQFCADVSVDLNQLPQIDHVDIHGLYISGSPEAGVVEEITFTCDSSEGVDGESVIATKLNHFVNYLHQLDFEEAYGS